MYCSSKNHEKKVSPFPHQFIKPYFRTNKAWVSIDNFQKHKKNSNFFTAACQKHYCYLYIYKLIITIILMILTLINIYLVWHWLGDILHCPLLTSEWRGWK